MRGADILRYEITSRPISNSFGKLFGSEAAGVEVVNSLADLVGVYEQKRITLERALETLARMTRRGTLRPEWIHSALRVVTEIRRKEENFPSLTNTRTGTRNTLDPFNAARRGGRWIAYVSEPQGERRSLLCKTVFHLMKKARCLWAIAFRG
jgi:hypothetical protein